MKPLNRRQFLGTVTAGAAALTHLQSQAAETPVAAPAKPAAPAGRTVKLGLIGCGWYGMVDVKAAFKAGGVEVVALCDVDSDHLEKSAAEVEKLQGSRPKTFKLYEEMLAAPGLEAVIIGTQPHWHALQLIAAVQRGLDVYCEKPLAYDVREGRAMVDAVAKSGRIVQIGLQRRQSPAYQAVKQFIADGHLGRVVQAEAQINYTNAVLSSAPQPPPATLDWDLWCGPAPLIPYSPQVGHKNWRQEKTTGQGHLYDWGLHLIDAARMILGETSPRAVSAAGGLFQLAGKITTPDTLTAQFEYARCPITWRHRMWGAEEHSPETNNGIFFYGEKGHRLRERCEMELHAARKVRRAQDHRNEGRSRAAAHGRIPRRRALAPARELHRRGRPPLHDGGETRDDRLRSRRAPHVGWPGGADRRPPGCGEIAEARLPRPVETSGAGVT